MRHGEVSYFAADGSPLDPRSVPLTATGRQQACAAQVVLHDAGLERVFASPLPRTQETARLATAEALPIEVIEDFREVHAGRLRDIAADQRRDAVVNAYRGAEGADARFLGGEEMAGFAHRVQQAWRALCFSQTDAWTCALLVAHDAVNRVILADVLDCGLEVIQRLEQDLAGIAIIDLAPYPGVDEARLEPPAVLRAMNVTAHDLGKTSLRLSSMEWVAQSV